MVTGPKTVVNIITNVTQLPPDFLLHGVNITEWEKKSFLLNRNNKLSGKVTFNNATFKEGIRYLSKPTTIKSSFDLILLFGFQCSEYGKWDFVR